MAISMTTKFDKYWKKSNVALAVASFLDPRFKKKIIEFYMRKFHGELVYEAETEKFMKIVKQLYQQYASAALNVTNSKAIVASRGETNILLDNNFEAHVADFGLAKLSLELDIQTHVSTRVMGTFSPEGI
ncbi:hypothetical protein OROMI_012621 [Orobanche minor]